MAPGTEATRAALMDPAKRPPAPREPLPRHLAEAVPATRFDLDPVLFSQNLRCARRGAAGGPSGMTSEHVRPLLDNPHDMERFWRMGQELARAETPDVVVDAIRLGRTTALSKPSGGVRGIVSGDIIRRLVARTVALQLNPEVEKATAPFQFALTTRCGGECVAHAIQAMTDIDPRADSSVRGWYRRFRPHIESSHDGRFALVGGGQSSPSLRSPILWCSVFLLVGGRWRRDTHSDAGRGRRAGRRSGALALFTGSKWALQSVASAMLPGERLFAFLDDVYARLRECPSCTAVCEQLCGDFARIRIHAGKTQL